MKIKSLLFIFLMFLTSLSFSQVFEKQGAGVTIITHGWNPDGSQPAWMLSMANAIIARSGGNGHIATITVTGTAGNLSAAVSDWNFDLANSNNAEIVILVNWTAVSNHLTTGITAQEVAAAVVPLIYIGQNGQIPLAYLPIHLIGHSRGGGMVFEIARLLGLKGIDIEQVTALDPHPLTEADPQPAFGTHTIDASISVYENILFADCYYQNIEYPTGQYIANAYNRLWTSLPGGYHNESGYTYNILGINYNFSDHLNIILAYHGTIDLTTSVYNGEATMNDDATNERGWFNTYENVGENTGFKYSRNIWGNRLSENIPVNGGEQINYGYHNDILLGGLGNRVAINWSSATWLSVLEVESSVNSTNFTVGTNYIHANDVIASNFIYRNYLSNASVKVSFDNDRNPYNVYLSDIQSGDALANGSTISSGSVNISVPDTFTVGRKYYLLFEITDEGTERFMYAPYELEYTNLITPEAGILTFSTTDLGTQTRTATENVFDLGNIASTDNLTSLTIEVTDDNINPASINVMYTGNVQGQMVYTGSNNLWQFNPTAPFIWSEGVNTLTTQFVDNDANTLDITVNFNLVQMYSLTFEVVNGNGTLSASDGTNTLSSPVNLETGTDITFTAAPDANYEVKEWTINGTIVSGNTSTTLVINDLAENTDVTVEFQATSSVNSISANRISIYPNPTSGTLIVNSEKFIVNKIEITDITGKIITSTNQQINKSTNQQIDISHLQNGIYFLKIETENGVFVEKIIKN